MEGQNTLNVKFSLEALTLYLEERPHLKSIALQFHDSDLAQSTKVYRLMRKKLPERHFYVLGDTSYSPCCIDDVNASHARKNDTIVKFGHSCLSTASKSKQKEEKELIYVMTAGAELDESVLKAELEQLKKDGQTVWLYADSQYYGQLVNSEEIKALCNFGYIDQEQFTIFPKAIVPEDATELLCGRKFTKEAGAEEKVLLYIGDYDPYGDEDNVATAPSHSKLEKFIVPNASALFKKTLYYGPAVGEVSEFKKTAKLVTTRYSSLQRVEDAEIIGILIGTVVCDRYMDIINALKRSILKAGKKYYEVLVGKINEPKLKNFQFIDLYVIIACPEQSLVHFKQFNTHVITPHEAMMALQPEAFSWESRVITDFREVLDRLGASEEGAQILKEGQQDILEHEFDADEQALVLVDKKHRELVPIFSTQVIQRYEQFTYKGLEVDLTEKTTNEDGSKKALKLEQGLVGIASGYEGEDKGFEGKF